MMNRAILCVLGLIGAVGPLGAQVKGWNWEQQFDKRKLRFLKPLVANKSVVQLGESIHLTDEFPRARLPLMRYLHEEMEFDIVAFEGSAVDSWLAQEYLFRSRDSVQDRAKRAQNMAWFGLWQTESMAEVMKYIASTQTATGRPLYLASFDVQPGSSREFSANAPKALDALLKAVETYQPEPSPGTFARWVGDLTPFMSCFRPAAPSGDPQRRAMDRSLAALTSWLRKAALKVQPAIHGRALSAVGTSLHGTSEMCAVVFSRPFGQGSYQRIRDRENALNVIALRDTVSQSGRIMLWAHHSHVNHNSGGEGPPAMGRTLREILGGRLYPIGVFAGGGEAYPSEDGLDFKPTPLRPASEFEIEGSLQSLSAKDFFVDFSEFAGLPSVLSRTATSRFEIGGKAALTLDRDFDAAIFLHTVNAPKLIPR